MATPPIVKLSLRLLLAALFSALAAASVTTAEAVFLRARALLDSDATATTTTIEPLRAGVSRGVPGWPGNDEKCNR